MNVAVSREKHSAMFGHRASSQTVCRPRLRSSFLVLGARLGGADPLLLERLRRFGMELGVAFQIADDVLDCDEQEPCSMVRVLGLAGARERADEKLASALAALEGLGERAGALRELARLAVHRDV